MFPPNDDIDILVVVVNIELNKEVVRNYTDKVAIDGEKILWKYMNLYMTEKDISSFCSNVMSSSFNIERM